MCDKDENGEVIATYDEAYRNYVYTLTLTARWKIETTAKVVYNAGAGSGTVTDSATYNFNDTVTVSADEPTPPANQLFAGWLDAKNRLHVAGSSFDFDDLALKERDGNENVIKLTAQYYTPKDVMITFDSAGGTAVSPVTLDAGEAVPTPAEPTRRGYTFTGWEPEVPATMPTANLNVTAQWKINQYTLSFDTGGGSPVADITQDYATDITAPANPTKTGYTFLCWEPEVPATMPASNMTLTAKWKINSYTVTFDKADGSEIELIRGPYHSWITAPENPTRDGYVFDGWDKEIPDRIPAANMTITAKWLKVLDVTAEDAKLVYDGAAHGVTVSATDGVTENSATVVYSETADGEYGASPTYTDVGTYTVFYQVTQEGAQPESSLVKLTISPKPVTVTANDQEVDLNAHIDSAASKATLDGAVNGHELAQVVLQSGSTENATNSGEITPSAAVIKSGDDDVTANYEITYETGVLTVKKGDIALTPPVALVLTYSGAEQELIEAGSVTAGTLLYSLTEDGDYSEELPTGKDAGIYTVWYQVDGGANYNDIAPASVSMTIEKKEVTVAGIAANDKPYDGTTEAALDYSDVTFDGIAEGDRLTITAVGEFENESVGADKTVNITELTLGGESVANYQLAAEGQPAKASILGRLTFCADSQGISAYKEYAVKPETSLAAYGGLTLEDTEVSTFAGWTTTPGVTSYLDADGKAAQAVDFSALTMPDSSLNIYPMMLTNEIEVTLDLGADDAKMDEAQERQFKVSAGGATLDMTYMNAATRPDYALEGWFTADGVKWSESTSLSRNYYDKGADGTVSKKYDEENRNYAYALTLTARWKQDIKASVVYDLYGGSGDIKDETVYAFNGTVNVSKIQPTPPEYQVFVGWKDAAGTLHSPESSFTFDTLDLRETESGKSVIKLTAQYVEEADVMITFDSDGGTAVLPITLKPGQPVTAENPVKNGFTFNGWTPELPTVMPDESLTLKANWTANQYTITFDAGEGNEIAPITQDYGTIITAPANPKKAGHTFDGWTPELPAVMPASDMTLTARWTANQYTITFNTGGGSAIAPIRNTYGAWITAPAAPMRDGYVFTGWDQEIPQTMPATDMTVTALWTKETYDLENVEADGWTGVYDGKAHGVTVHAPDGVSVTYSETEDGSYSATMPTYTNAGTYTVFGVFPKSME